MEALQLLKFLIRRDRLSFTADLGGYDRIPELVGVADRYGGLNTPLAAIFGDNGDDAEDAILDDVVSVGPVTRLPVV